jgi:4-hydroxy-L-threonine phosphate dehydrogenase PdxA
VIKVGSIAGVGLQVTKEKNPGEMKANAEVFFTHLTALTNTGSRTVRTRRLAQAQDDPEVNKTAKLAKVSLLLFKSLHYFQCSSMLITNTQRI